MKLISMSFKKHIFKTKSYCNLTILFFEIKLIYLRLSIVSCVALISPEAFLEDVLHPFHKILF